MRIRQSDLSSYARCPQQKHLYDQQKAGLLSKAPEQLSRTAFGSVMHHATFAMEMAHAQGQPDPLAVGLSTFEYYWDPAHISAVCDPVTIWAARDNWSGMLRRGLATLRVYWEHLKKDTGRVLGLEVHFELDIEIDGRQHTLVGTMDRLSLRKRSGQTVVEVEDFKTGVDYIGLRWNNQFTVYSWATTQPAFWDQWGDPMMAHRLRLSPRHGTWISLHNGAKRSDAGFRGPQDYERMKLGLREYIKANELGVFPLSLTGSVCRYCPFREGLCGGVPVPDDDYGKVVST